MNNKLIYWIPVVGVFFTLINYRKDNNMNSFWPYYQAVVSMATIGLITYFSFGA